MANIDTEDKRGFLARFWGFDRLIGSALIKAFYYIGLVLIILGAVIGFGALVIGGKPGVALAVLVGAPIYLILFRFMSELALLAFLTYNRLGEIRDRLPETEAEWIRILKEGNRP